MRLKVWSCTHSLDLEERFKTYLPTASFLITSNVSRTKLTKKFFFMTTPWRLRSEYSGYGNYKEYGSCGILVRPPVPDIVGHYSSQGLSNSKQYVDGTPCVALVFGPNYFHSASKGAKEGSSPLKEIVL